jgi:hypothetical protein
MYGKSNIRVRRDLAIFAAHQARLVGGISENTHAAAKRFLPFTTKFTPGFERRIAKD